MICITSLASSVYRECQRLAVQPALLTTASLYPSNAQLTPDFNEYVVSFVNKLFISRMNVVHMFISPEEFNFHKQYSIYLGSVDLPVLVLDENSETRQGHTFFSRSHNYRKER